MTPKRVLLVEDDIAFQQLVKFALRDLGCQLEVSTTGDGALQLLQENSYDVVISDYRLPEMDGLTVLRAALNNDECCKAVLVSATPRNTLDTEMQGLEVAGFLQKPASPTEILDEVSKAL